MGNGCFFIEGPFDGGLFRFFNGALKRDWLLIYEGSSTGK